MPIRLGPAELTIILVIVILLFGAGRIGKIAGELGSGIREFQKSIKGPESTDQGLDDTKATDRAK
ncbi:MAG: twin-arginine translocase TatA/TatE family subunit [Anaerolineales bacterium]|nr:twin-arginine translocase TatA/TatE family subunit [Anaerolineales bacterium]